ncbi:MAG TPA: rRNA maturation RNase YbeY [candidate division Zixibacteria bacterium]|nr:rRNA maturation RNase YbeY [candidate division Zixibacteria bacterium]
METTLPTLDVPREALVESICRVLKGEGRDHAAVTMIFIDDAYIRRLNREYRHLDRATDVLSFKMDDGTTPDQDLLGEIYISMDRARDQAVRYHVSVDEELQRLVVHGCLHLLGYDHHRTAERRVMRQKEAHYLSSDTGSISEG